MTGEFDGSKLAVRAEVLVDLSRIPKDEFDASKELLVGVVRDGEVLGTERVTPAKENDPRKCMVTVSLPSEDGVAGASVVVAPADDERNLFSEKAARAFISGRGEMVKGVVAVNPGIYRWWRFCWFPYTYHVTGRVVHHDGNCAHPIGGANVELFDVDYCWWWYSEELVTTGTTDPDGFFDITFTWCVPLWCLFENWRPPIYIDPDLLRRLHEVVEVNFPLPPDPGGPVEWEQWLVGNGVELPASVRTASSPELPVRGAAPSAVLSRQISEVGGVSRATAAKSTIDWRDLFGHIIRWPCSDPCDWWPDIRIRVTQNQPGGTAEIYSDGYQQIHWDLAGDLLNLTLEANESALFGDSCRPDPILGNCMLFERAGDFNVSTIYAPDVAAGEPYGATPDRSTRLGRTISDDRAWCLTTGVHGDFGLAANVDYYQVEVAAWTAADIAAWSTGNTTYRPPDSSFLPLIAPAAAGFTRTYAREIFGFYVWAAEGFGPATVGGVPGVYKSRQKFQQEYEAAHGGPPAPDFASGWYWDTTAMTRLFDFDSTKLADGLYTFRLVGYEQTGVDAGGQPILAEVNMGLSNGVCRRCGDADVPELLTLLVRNQPRVPVCSIDAIKKNGVSVGECEIVVLGTTDSLDVDFTVGDARGELDLYALSIQRGSDSPHDALTLGGPWGQPTTYAEVIAANPLAAPVWTGGSWSVNISAADIAALGGSCAYAITLDSYDRQTNGYSVDWSDVECWKQTAFTVILAADRDTYCAQLGCPPMRSEPGAIG